MMSLVVPTASTAREGCGEMQRVLCWLLGHDRMPSRSSHRICLRCGQRDKLQNLGHVRAWVETTGTPSRD